jgi:hypothetical protein
MDVDRDTAPQGGARDGLASHGVAPAVLSGAAMGHDRVRDGSGWVHGARGHGHPPGDPYLVPHTCYWLDRPVLAGSGCASPGPAGSPRPSRRKHRDRSVPRHGGGRSPLAHQHGSAPVGCPLSTSRLSTRSSAGGLSRFNSGVSRLGAGFPLRCLQRFAFPHVATQRCRFPDNWLTSGASIPVLSY